jgi:O-antigen biosynthesis protein
MGPILHYLLYGTVEGKNPSPEFNTNNYLSIYVDVANHGMNPFMHYINYGKAEGRKADPLQKRLPSPKDQ